MPVTSACQAGLPQVTSRKPGAGAGGGLVQPVRTSAVWRLFCGTQAAGDESWLSPPRLSPKTFSVFKSQTRWVTKIKKNQPMSGRTLRNADSSLLEGTVPLAETVLSISKRGSEVRRHVLAPEQGLVFWKRAHECSRMGSFSGLWVRYCSWSPRARFKCSLIPEPCTNEVSRTGVLLTQSLDPGAYKLGCGKRKSL